MSHLWIRRRWLDFRQGHGVYLIFAMAFANFILIFHRLLIERIDVFNQIFPNLWTFAIIFVVLYIPIAILIGRWHRKTQIRVETEQNLRNNPFMARNFRMLIDIIDGRASKEQIESYRKLLVLIEEGKGSSPLDSKQNTDN